jgi:hypothetical protein
MITLPKWHPALIAVPVTDRRLTQGDTDGSLLPKPPGRNHPGRAATIAAVVDTFVRATKTSGLETEFPAHPENVSEMFGTRADGQFNP